MTIRGVFPLPTTLAEIDAEWVTLALRTRAPDVTVRQCELVDIIPGTCTKVRLRLDVDEAGMRARIPTSVILKGGFEPHSRAMASMHERESQAYQHVLPKLGLPSPRCYFADYDAEQQQGIILIEDLRESGVTFGDPLKPPGKEAITSRLSVLARFHAKTWSNSADIQNGEWSWLQDINSLTRDYSGPYLEPETWSHFIASPRGAAVSVRFHDREWMRHALDRSIDFAAQRPMCVMHSDTHVGNTYVYADGTPGFFDPQPSWGPGLLEISYNLVCALDSADRPNWEASLIKHYLAELEANGVEAPDFDDAMRQYGIYLARAYFIFVVNEAHWQSESINTAYTARINAAMLDHDTIGLIASL